MSRTAVRAVLSISSLAAFVGIAHADGNYPVVRFVPPPLPITDPAITPTLNPSANYNAGTIFNQSAYPGGASNDGFSQGRGIVFTPDTNFDLGSVGIRLNGVDVVVNFTVALAGSTGPGVVNPGTVLESGTAGVNTGGQFTIVNFLFDQTPVTLLAGQNYVVQFQFAGNPLQNQFFDTRNSQTDPGRSWTQGSAAEGLTLSNVRGTLNGSTFPTSAPITLNFVGGITAASAPEPGSVLLLGVGIGLLAGRLRRRA